MNRTQQEIVKQIAAIEKSDVLGFGRSVLIDFLDFGHAQPFLIEGVTEEEWLPHVLNDPIKEIRDYLPFAWEKANSFRGISAYRSLAKLEQWAWLSGDEQLMGMIDSDDYCAYGKDQLADVSEYLKLDVDALDDGVRLDEEPV